MHLLGKVTVDYKIPDRISRLKELAYNLWWCWNYDAKDLFKMIDPDLFQNLRRNPVKLLKEVDYEKLKKASEDSDFLKMYDSVVNSFTKYMDSSDTWFATKYPNYTNHCVAYFSAEFGFHESVPIYSGGLGVLAGDHCKSASDLGLPLVAIGLLYNEGYFIQRLTAEGWQESRYEKHEFSDMAVQPALNSDGSEVIINVELPGRIVYAKVWRVNVGRVRVFLLDTDIALNNVNDRNLTNQLYGGDHEMRISQEILLGVGGVRTYRALGIRPRVWHMNEGHSVFSILERIREHINNRGLDFNQSLERIRGNTIFTTHTPVPAGNDAFSLDLMEKYFKNFREIFGIDKEKFFNMGKHSENGREIFSLTVFALRTAGISNGVSKLHGEVSRNIWEFVWPNIPTDEGPITHITNGVHTLSWLAPEIKKYYDKYLERHWAKNIDDVTIWEKIDNIPDEDLWKTHTTMKTYMIWHIRKRLKKMKKRYGVSPEYLRNIDKVLDPNVLTIGFARRFATYKRADLLFRDYERIKNLIVNKERPVQFIFAGKAHPADQPGKEIIKKIFELANRDELWYNVVVVEDYDMELARYLVRGVDVWLNNPRRPLEASGTSGMKVVMNGGINFSVSDGWWCEGYNGENGWVIGDEEEYQSLEHQDNADSESMYETLIEKIIPLYYDIDTVKKLPLNWINKMRESIKTLTPAFNTNRMVKEYTDHLYIKGMERAAELGENNYHLAKELSKWKEFIKERWSAIKIEPIDVKTPVEGKPITIKDTISIKAKVTLGELKPEDVNVEIYYGKFIEGKPDLKEKEYVSMTQKEKLSNKEYIYEGDVVFKQKGDYGYTVRVIPYHKNLPHKHDVGLITWLTPPNQDIV